MSENEEVAQPQAEKMSDHVLINRYADEYTLVGPAKKIMPIDEAAEILAATPWMRLWIAEKVKEALLLGEIFTYSKRVTPGWKGREDGIASQYRQATREEVLNYADTASGGSVNGSSISRRSQEKAYILMYHEGPELIEAYEGLPRQAKVILDILNEAGRETFSEASMTVLLEQEKERLRTKQDPMTVFAFYRARLIEEGHLVPTGDSD